MPLFKIRITSPDPVTAEALRQCLKFAFGDKLTLQKARKGSNPKYAHLDQVLAYGELELSAAELAAFGTPPPAPAAPTRSKAAPKSTRSKAIAPAAPVAYTQQTISLNPKKPRSRKVKP